MNAAARLNDPATIRASIEHIEKIARQLQQALWGVTGGSLVFTCLTVTVFGMKHGVPGYIAWLLEPLVAIALIAVLLGDGVLSNYGEKAPGWAQFLRWFAGMASWTMNVWQSVFFVDDKTGKTEFKPDAAGIVLHSIVPLLVILLAESAPRYRRRFSIIAEKLKDRLAQIEGQGVARSTVPPRPVSNRATEPRTVPPTRTAPVGSVESNRAKTVPSPSQATTPTVPAAKPVESTTVPPANPATEPVTAGAVAAESDSGSAVPPEVRPGVTPPDYVIATARRIYAKALDGGLEMSDRKLAAATREFFSAPHAVIGRSACQKIIADVERDEATG